MDNFKGRSVGSRSGSLSRSSGSVSTGVIIASGNESARTGGSVKTRELGGSVKTRELGGSVRTGESGGSNKSSIDYEMIIIIIVCVMVGVIFIYNIIDFVNKYKKYKDNNANGTVFEFIKLMFSSDKSNKPL